ncbi:Homocysteine S-methyltransferase [Ascochyta rabiei]|uniref:S-adenosylmethionine-homocysteine S-methyltransferase n=1 Tax=Didymella rabiei TaxID=5454 RepID=A0A163CS83_DIDRA|nr:Homocysteine S-methyltransferase [Ascochyta rabiei]KZM22656.1 S-adenosylmethionine-homocysteine S-methyltransferase [Ascochyta rabiei]UPX19298.1 Homocysteine S-methyltransferase [Ascochyta rabiei]
MTNGSKLSSLLEAPVLLDGALATYLETLGADISGALWSAEMLLQNPALIKQTHLDYYRAGAQVAITASYQASLAGLGKHLSLDDEQGKAVVRKSVELAQEARDEWIQEHVKGLSEGEKLGILERSSIADYRQSIRNRLFVAGSVGPYGAFLADGSEYRGDYHLSKEEMKAFHRGRIQALVEACVDVLACETIPSLRETEALLELLSEEFKGTEAWFAFTLRDAEHISDGTPLTQMAALFESAAQVIAIGFNCVPDDVGLEALKVLRPLQRGRKWKMMVYPNSGEQWNAAAREWEGLRTEGGQLAAKTEQWAAAGAVLVGGCCRTTPTDITVMRDVLQPKKEGEGVRESYQS